MALEGRDDFVLVSLVRDSQIYSGDITLQYTTSDITAVGINATHFDACLLVTISERSSNNCGNYQLSNGFITITDGTNYGLIKIPIMNDLCQDRFLKYLQVSSSSLCHCTLTNLPWTYNTLMCLYSFIFIDTYLMMMYCK